MRSIILCSYPQDQQRGKDGRQEGAVAQTKSQEEKEGRPSQALASQKVRAKGSARKAGRPYPNLVDNMLVTRKSKKRKKGRGSSSARTDGACIVKVEPGKARCRFHGGLSHSRPAHPLLGAQTASVAHSADWNTSARVLARAQYEVDPIVVVRENFVACTMRSAGIARSRSRSRQYRKTFVRVEL